ncbi:MAG: DUF808 domain-containing protein [Flavobacteriales bacterium]
MASGFFALLDDIALLMDDVAAMSKVATKKTAGILGDDLAVNAEKAIGFKPSRELPVLWSITKGSFLNKLIIVPVALVLSSYAPWVIEPILLAGGGFLAYEGMEKIWHHLNGQARREAREHHSERLAHQQPDTPESARKKENEKVKSALLVDFILSVEIVIIAMSAVAEADLWVRAFSVSWVAFLATIGVYGLVALIVRMDDAGLALMKWPHVAAQTTGKVMVKGLPVLIKVIGALGTVALILVAGGIFMHHIPGLHHFFEGWPDLLAEVISAMVLGTGLVLAAEGLRYLRLKD